MSTKQYATAATDLPGIRSFNVHSFHVSEIYLLHNLIISLYTILRESYTNCWFSDEPKPKPTPCEPSPCGPNSVCRAVGETPSCSCMSGFYGNPPYCRPECVSNSDCNFDKSCINNKCADPCVGACGINTECRVISHSPQCYCRSGYEGDPFDQCLPVKGMLSPLSYVDITCLKVGPESTLVLNWDVTIFLY